MAYSFQDHFISLTHGSRLAVRCYGNENAATLLVLGGISGGRNVYQAHGRGWWQGLIDAAQLQDYRLITLDYLGGMGESECAQVPDRIAPHAEVIAEALSVLGVRELYALIGGSFGGCVAMEMVRQRRLNIQRLAVLGAAHRPAAQAVMIRDLQRQFVQQGAVTRDAIRGIELARALAMLSYRGAQGLDTRFPDPKAAVHYMYERAERLVKQNPSQAAQLFLKFGPALDHFRIAPVELELPTFVVGFSSDFLAPQHLVDEFVQQLPQCKAYVQVDTVDGHDGFILNTAAYGPQLRAFLEEI